MSVIGEVSTVGIIPALWTERTDDDDHNSTEGEDLPKTAEAQQLFYFGKKANPRFEILPDPNGHNVFDTLDLELATEKSRIGQNWTKPEVLNVLHLIYRRIEAFLKTLQIKGHTNSYSKWQVKLEKKKETEVAKSNAQMGIPVLPPPKFRTKTAQKLQVITRASSAGAVYIDEWEENGNYRYEIEGGVHRVMFNGFSWSWGVSSPFSIQSRSSRLAAPAPIEEFDKPLSINRFGSNSTSKVKFSNPYAIEVLFQK